MLFELMFKLDHLVSFLAARQ